MRTSHREEKRNMAKQNKNNVTVETAVETATVETAVVGEILNKGEVEAFEAFDTRISVAVRGVESNMLQIFGALAVISEKNLHRVRGYKNAREYIEAEHGMKISKGQLSDAVNTFKKFGDMETGYLRDEWLPYTFSQLKLMRKLTDEELADVTPAISCRELQNIINGSKAIEEKSEETAETEETAENVSRETSVDVKEETSGEIEPYVEWTYDINEFRELDGEILKILILEQFEQGNKVILNYK